MKLKKKHKYHTIVVCNKCNGTLKIKGYGAFGENETYNCTSCNNTGYQVQEINRMNQ